MSPLPTFNVVTRVPLPAYLAPEAVVAALHAYIPLIEANPHLQSYERRPISLDEVVDDPFFRDDGHKLQAFRVHHRIPIIPGVGSWATKDVVVPCIFQSFEYGARCRADAQAGVTVWSSYEVRPRGQVVGGEPPCPPTGDEPEGDFELVEVAIINCGTLVKPFVRRSLAGAHQEILQRVADDVARSLMGQPI
ncbi:hypothetical protein B0T25DRAFT_194442 [Lasiosphaeria hispida]|uniref:DUF7053 domain-containing protein n=1 Tax=Lasiosphaeria hispida TaxID=260671 RepID=A0AAJ0MDU5_9PEZI|nr:hypothetical protein B0T25DRAFT_194442 [Lasiosphaeria hispida]